MGVIKDVLTVIFVQIVVEQITNLFYNKLGFGLLIEISGLIYYSFFLYFYRLD